MNTKETAKLTGIPEDILIRMRARETRSLKSGPPYSKKMDKSGAVTYVYNKAEVQKWLKFRRCLITAADAAVILNCAREDILAIYGLQSIPVRTKRYKGRLVVDNG